MKRSEIIAWLTENPDEADKLRNLLMTKDEILRRAATLLAEEVDEDIIGPLTEKFSARRIMRLKQQLELAAFDRQAKRDRFAL